MTPAVYDTVRADIVQNGVIFRTTGSKLKFAGFTKVYDNQQEMNVDLPDLEEGDKVKMTKSDNKQHFTLPPARYTEASLVHRIGRKWRGPSFNLCTYNRYNSNAAIMLNLMVVQLYQLN